MRLIKLRFMDADIKLQPSTVLKLKSEIEVPEELGEAYMCLVIELVYCHLISCNTVK